MALGIVLAAGIAGGAWWVMSQTRSQPGVSNGTVGTSNPTVGQVAPDFNLKSLDGKDIRLSEYRGQKPVILDFWASWSPDSRRNMPLLEQLYVKYKDQVEVIAINRQESDERVRDFVAAHELTFTVVLDPIAEIHSRYGDPYANTHILIDRGGNIAKIIYGDITEAEISQLLGTTDGR